MEFTETHLRVLELLRIIKMPCELSLQQVAVVIGVSRYKIRTILDDLDGKEIKFTPGSGRSKSIFEPIDDKGKAKQAKITTPITEKKPTIERHLYGSCVWLSDNEYRKFTEIFTDEHSRELAITRLSCWKESHDKSDVTIGDMKHMLGWVKNLMLEDKEKRRKKEEQNKALAFYREEQNLENERRIESNIANACSPSDYKKFKEEFLKTHTEEELMQWAEQQRKINATK